MMKLTLLERLALLEAEVIDLRAAVPGQVEVRACVKELLFYSEVEAGDQIFHDGRWETVSTVDDSDPNVVRLDFESELSVRWKKSREILRRTSPDRIPEVPNRVPRSRRQ